MTHNNDDENYVESDDRSNDQEERDDDEEERDDDEEDTEECTDDVPVLHDHESSVMVEQFRTVHVSYNDDEIETVEDDELILYKIEEYEKIIAESIRTGKEVLLMIEGKAVRFNHKQKRRLVFILLALSFCKRLFPHTTKLREFFYFYKKYFKNQRESNRAIEDVCSLLGVQRHQLGLSAEPKGLLWGKLRIVDPETGELALNFSESPLLITNIWEGKSLSITCPNDSKCILVLEKAGILRRLVEDILQGKVDNYLKDCILVTGRGFPDVSTREAVRQIHENTDLPVFVLVDDDPHGVHIFKSYQRAGIPAKWLGLCPSQVRELTRRNPPWISQEMLLKLSELEEQRMLNGLIKDDDELYTSDFSTMEDQRDEIASMTHKVKLEALYTLDFGYCAQFVKEMINYELEQIGDKEDGKRLCELLFI